jgi:maltose alpha-D-glucosyltransferase/alpha-amylase
MIDDADDPLRYRARSSELRRAFGDSDGDGVGDFRGLTDRLEYLQQLGVTAIWLLPFYPSPLRDDGYDIADYANVNPAYGTLRDFRAFLKEAHARDLRVITELVLNHTSDQHPWFQRARRAPAGSRWRDFYVWSDTPEKYQDARIIFKDFEPSNWTWDPVAKSYYWHRFYPSPTSTTTTPRSARPCCAWSTNVEMGVDGVRLAVPYLFERGTNGETCRDPRSARAGPRRPLFPGLMLLGEANQWPGTRSPTSAGAGRRVPHGVPLPAHAAPVHVVADGGPVPGDRHPPADAAIPETARWRSSCATTTS